MGTKGILLLTAFLFTLSPVLGSDNTDDYMFSTTLNQDPEYVLHWSVDLEEEEVRFALEVESTGWIGLGISENGQMIGSDVFTTWIDDQGEVQLQDRFATALSRPPMDNSQDWELVGGGVTNGHTFIEVKRKFRTCDEDDIDITTSTAYLVWSLNNEDMAKDLSVDNLRQHTDSGSIVINLLGKVEAMPDPADYDSFTIGTNNTEVPVSKTTYWCTVVPMPRDEKYIYKFGASISEGSEEFVHHMLVYQCPSFAINDESDESLRTSSMECDNSHRIVQSCRGTNVLAGWAIGGQDFNYPKDVAYKIGPGASKQYAVLEVHYDNPKQVEGHIDSSGIKFFTTTTSPTYLAGVMTVGHHVASNMIIPPGVENYSVTGTCSSQCLEKFLAESINVFGGLLHTHLAGKSLKLHHYRRTDKCGGVEELKPIDQNLNYNVEYQQVNLFPHETQVLPGDHLALQCSYNTTNRSSVTLGGEGTYDEMCLTFLFYYPQQELTLCSSMPDPVNAYLPLQDALRPDEYSTFQNYLKKNFGIIKSPNIKGVLASADWNAQLTSEMQSTVNSSKFIQLCLRDFASDFSNDINSTEALIADCPYVPEPCSSSSIKGAGSFSLSALVLGFSSCIHFSLMY